ncbi:MAG: class I SAM-dependent methyltransferase [Thermoleophilia bacterium]
MHRKSERPLDGSPLPISSVLEEAASSGLALGDLPGNTAKIRLIIDLAGQVSAASRTRVLDVGAGGKFFPFNLWEPFLPYAGVMELCGIDLAHLDATAARAAEIGFPVDLRPGSVHSIIDIFGRDGFDAIVSTQVLEHLRDWKGAVEEMAHSLRPGGTLYLTCDSGDLALPAPRKLRLAAKCTYARVAEVAPALRRSAERVLSGEWEKAPTLAQLREHALRLGLEVEAIRHYGVRELKATSRDFDSDARLHWFALEEQLVSCDPGAYTLLYLRARRPLHL